MHTGLPETFSPQRLASEGTVLKGSIAVSELPRLMPLLGSAAGAQSKPDVSQEPLEPTVRVSLNVERTESGRLRLLGELAAGLDLQCQRCLGDLRYDLNHTLSALVVADEAGEAALPINVEGVVAADDRLRLLELIEDELLLALPSAPVHPLGSCTAPQVDEDGKESESGDPSTKWAADEHETTRRPFSGLADLLSQN